MFEGFSQETVDFMWGIRFNNERGWFEAHGGYGLHAGRNIRRGLRYGLPAGLSAGINGGTPGPVYEPDETIERGTTKVDVTPYTGYEVDVYRCVYDRNLKSREG